MAAASRRALSEAAASFPSHPGQLSAAWLQQALTAAGRIQPGASVSGFACTPMGEGVGLASLLARVSIAVQPPPGARAPPETLSAVAKFPPADGEAAAAAARLGAFVREAGFYGAQASRRRPWKLYKAWEPLPPSLPTPAVWFAAAEAVSGRACILLEDLGEMQPGDQVVGATPAQAAGVVADAAALHASFWGDRVLLWLEAVAAGRPPPEFDIRLCEELRDAAAALGLRALEDAAGARLGEFTTRLRVYSADELAARNAAGECIITVDGMVLDLTRWLPEHPGGSTIIPSQALGIDASTMFELYHASRESFLYLKHFYLGELAAEDALPPPVPPPSPEFLQQLREYTTFRLAVARPGAAAKHL